MHRCRRWLMLVLVPLAAVGTLATAAPADAPVPSSTVFTYHAASIFQFDLTPDLVPSADCVFHSGNSTTSTYWFGYSLTNGDPVHDLPANLVVGPNNMFEELDPSGAVVDSTANRGQVTNFQTGTHNYQFGVTVATGDALRWTVTAPDPASNPQFGYWTAQLTTVTPPACPPGYGQKSVAPQTTGFASLKFAPTGDVISKGLLKKGKVQFSVTGVTSTCSAGGTPLEPRVLWGFQDFTFTAANNFAPVTSVVRVDTFDTPGGPSTFVRTWAGTRTIVDPQVPYTVPGGASSHGLATTNVLADVYGRCSFVTSTGATKIVTSVAVLWTPDNGGPQTYGFVTDADTQVTRLATCLTADTCEFSLGSGGGGIKFR